MLFKKGDINKLKEYADIAVSSAWESMQPTLRDIEENDIKNIVGTSLLTGLQSAFAAVTEEASLDVKWKALLHQVRKVAGPLLCFYYAPMAELHMSDAGLQRMETANNKTAYQYQVTNYRNENRRKADVATEQLFAFLELNRATYTEWGDALRAKYRGLFIKSGSEFKDLFTCQSPYRIYYAMRAKMTDVEQLYVRFAMDREIYDYLKEKDMRGAALNELEKGMTEKLKRAIAYYAVAYSIPYLNVRIDENGITLVTQMAGSSKDADKRQPAKDNALSLLISSCIDTGNAWMKSINELLEGAVLDESGLRQAQPDNGVGDATNVPDDQWHLDCGGKVHYPAEKYNPRGYLYDDDDEKGSFSM